MREVWKDIIGYENKYLISNKGRVQNKNTLLVLKPQKMTSGYHFNCLMGSKSIPKGMSIHRMVGYAFIPNPENKPEINHINGVKIDNRVENLEWCTRLENIRHAKKMGLIPKRIGKKGEDHGRSILTEKNVIYIRQFFDGKKVNKPYLANKFGVSVPTIKAVLTRRNWKHLN